MGEGLESRESRGQISVVLTRDFEDYGDTEDSLDEKQRGEEPSWETRMGIEGE